MQLRPAQRAAEAEAEERGEQFRHLLTGELPAGEKGFAAGGMLNHEGGGAAKLSSDGEALEQSGGKNPNGCDQPDRGIGGHEGHDGCADDHQPDGKSERGFSAGAVSISAQNNRPERTGQVRQAKRSEGEQQRDHRVGVGKEDAGDGSGEVAVDEDVKPLQHIADGGGRDLESSAGRPGRPERAGRTGRAWRRWTPGTWRLHGVHLLQGSIAGGYHVQPKSHPSSLSASTFPVGDGQNRIRI